MVAAIYVQMYEGGHLAVDSSLDMHCLVQAVDMILF